MLFFLHVLRYAFFSSYMIAFQIELSFSGLREIALVHKGHFFLLRIIYLTLYLGSLPVQSHGDFLLGFLLEIV